MLMCGHIDIFFYRYVPSLRYLILELYKTNMAPKIQSGKSEQIPFATRT